MKFLILSLILMNFAFAQQDVSSRSDNIAQARVELEAVMDKKPYQGPEHASIKKYFSDLQTLIEDLESFPKYKKRFNQMVRSEGIETYCKKVFLDSVRWKDLVKNCTKNNFFLCAEDVRIFPETKLALSNMMDADLKAQFLATNKCKE